MSKSNLEPIAITGIATHLPGRGGTAGFWRDVIEGQDARTDVPRSYWSVDEFFSPDLSLPDKTYSRHGAFFPEFSFDPMKFGTPPAVVETTDTVQLLALYVAKRMMEEVRSRARHQVDPERTSIILGVAAGTELIGDMAARLVRPEWIAAMRAEGIEPDRAEAIANRISSYFMDWRESTFPGALGNVVAGRIANRLNLGGTNFTADAACASSLAALSFAIQELQLGDSDMVVCGGADALNNIFMYMCFSKTPAMSPTGHCRPFSDDADGTIMGDGCALFTLRRLSDAERDGDSIYAVITGVGSSSDGGATSVYAPRSGGQALAIRRAYERAGYSPRTVELCEAHGTGTKAGDLAEIGGLKEAFEPDAGGGRNWCGLGSVKSQIGHTKSAAGAAGLAKVAMALHHKVLPPTIKVSRPNPNLDIESSPFYLNTIARPWVRTSDHPRRAGVSSFGFGGSNFHATLEEYSGPAARPPRLRTTASELILFSGQSLDEIGRSIAEFCERIRDDGDLSFEARATLEAFDTTHLHRLSIVAKDRQDLLKNATLARTALDSGAAPSAPDIAYHCGAEKPGKMAFLFSGQGSQYLRMGGDLAMAFPSAQAVWDWLADSDPKGTEGLAQIVHPRPVFDDTAEAALAARLTLTQNAQPALAAVALSQLAVLNELGIRPDAVAGHSFGEVMALAAAGVLSPSQAVCIARRRGELMAEAADAGRGSMLAIQSDRETVERAIAECQGVVSIANDNAPNQVVISGDTSKIEALEAVLSDQGLRVHQLPVSAAFHSPHMDPAVDAFHGYLSKRNFNTANISVYSNATAQPYEAGCTDLADILASQLRQPVRFREIVEALYADGVRTFLEVGPGSVLTSLVARNLGDRPHRAVAVDTKRGNGLTDLQRVVGQLATAGYELDLSVLWREAPPEARLPEPKSHEILLSGANLQPKPRMQLRTGEVPLPTTPSSTGDGSAAAVPPNSKAAETIITQPAFSLSGSSAIEFNCACSQSNEEAHEPCHLCQSTSNIGNELSEQEMNKDILELSAALQREAAAVHRHFVDQMTTAQTAFLENTAQVFERAMADGGYVSDKLSSDEHRTLEGKNVPADKGNTAADSEESASVRQAPTTTSHHGSEAFDGTVPQTQVDTRNGHSNGETHWVEKTRPASEDVDTISPEPKVSVGDVQPTQASALNAPDGTEVIAVIREVVADKTGYPAEMLEPEMDLEAELGIDSIKQVEVLSALQTRFPELPEIETSQLAELRTLGQIAEAISGSAPTTHSKASESTEGPVAEPPVVQEIPQTQSAQTTTTGDSGEMIAAVREVIAEKTGYPADMLEPAMDLEAELGIDSIKQVEVLSALQNRYPELPELETSRLAEMRTLGQIADAISGASVDRSTCALPSAIEPTQSSAASLPIMTAAAEPAARIDDGEMIKAVRDVIAEKTGYPAEMLEPEMDLEAELGIDSIKQVEVLSALQGRFPDLPEIETSRLAELRTLGQIANVLTEQRSDAVIVASAPSTERKCARDPAGNETYKRIFDEAMHLGLGLQATSLVHAQSSNGKGILPEGRLAIEVTSEAPDLAQEITRLICMKGHLCNVVDAPSPSANCVISTAGAAEDLSGQEQTMAAFRTARSFGRAEDVRTGCFVLLQNCGGDFGRNLSDAPRADGGGLTGLAKTAALEWPKCNVKAIDLDCTNQSPEALANAVVGELLWGGNEIEVGLTADGQRLVPSALEIETDSDARLELPSGSVIVVPGGARGVTATVVKRLASHGSYRFLLLGRSDCPSWPSDLDESLDEYSLRNALAKRISANGQAVALKDIAREAKALIAGREIANTIAEISRAGSEARYVSADITDPDSTKQAIDACRQDWGQINGLIFGAGMLADKLIVDKTEEQFLSVYRTKVDGYHAVMAALASDNLSFVAIFSSVAARCGNIGQSDYATANEVLNRQAWVTKNNRPDCRVLSINWGPWMGGMVNDALQEHFEKLGVPLIPLSVGAEAFVAMLVGGVTGPEPDVLFGGRPTHLAESQKTNGVLMTEQTNSAS